LRNITVDTTETNIPFAVIDNFFNSLEQEKILEELAFIRPHFAGYGGSGGAVSAEGVQLKHTNSLWLTDFYSDPSKSSIFKLTRQYQDPDLLFEIGQKTWFPRMLTSYQTVEAIQLLYYESNSSYDTHFDTAFLTFLYWTHKEPRKFEGGDLVLEETSRIECKANRLLVFPSFAKHRVTPVKMMEKADGYGRYCISNFVHLQTLPS
jgi:hypothetical protein